MGIVILTLLIGGTGQISQIEVYFIQALIDHGTLVDLQDKIVLTLLHWKMIDIMTAPGVHPGGVQRAAGFLHLVVLLCLVLLRGYRSGLPVLLLQSLNLISIIQTVPHCCYTATLLKCSLEIY